MKFHRIFGPSLCPSKSWYAVSLEAKDGRIREYINNEICKFFSNEFAEVSIDTLVDCYGQRVPYEWFGSSRKKTSVLAATAFGLLSRSLRSKSLKSDKFIQSSLFSQIISSINNISLQDEMAGTGIPAPAIIQHTPPPTPSPTPSPTSSPTSSPTTLSNVKSSIKTLADINEMSLGVRQRAKALESVSNTILKDLKIVVSDKSEEFGEILGNCYLYCGQENSAFVSEMVRAAVKTVASKYGFQEAFRKLTGNLHEEFLNSIIVPDWVQVYVKLACKIPDRSWQTLLNYLNIGKSGKATDAALLLTNNSIRSHKQMVFAVTRQTFKMEVLPKELRGYGIGLPETLIWAIRESRLHKNAPENMIFNLKLDGRPLAGKEQVSVGIVPIGIPSNGNGNQSSLSVYPLAIANCSENRDDLKMLISRVNEEKRKIKEKGIIVDGKNFKINFKVTLDLKALLKLIVKKKDETFELGGRGFDKEFCMFCDAIRACKEHMNGSFNEVCVSCLRSKANIGRGSGIRDDLRFLLEEDLSNIVLCSLHCEMRNTEQLLGSLGLFAYKCNSLDECNESLSCYGPENSRDYSRIKVELRKGQETAVTKSNIVVTSFSGSTERKILENVKDIVNKSLPLSKVTSYFKEVEGAANSIVLSYVSFVTDEITYLKDILTSQKFMRDFGTKQEEVLLDNNKDLKSFLQHEVLVMEKDLKETENMYLLCCNKEVTNSPPRKRAKKSKSKPQVNHARENALAELAATINVNCIQEVFQGWSEIAKVMRDEVFEEEEEQKIDVFDVKCKLWGRKLRFIFGATLGTGDYGHLTVDHSSMLLRMHRSFAHYSNQGFEASHKVHRALYSRATNHDQGGVYQSNDQIIAHWLSEMMLHLRIQFVKAKECIQEGKESYYFRGCGWKSKPASWSEADIWWIFSITKLFEHMYGKDSLEYNFITHHGTKISDSCDPRQHFTYDHDKWESDYEKMTNEIKSTTKSILPRRRRLYSNNLEETSQSTYQPDGMKSTSTPTNIPTPSTNTAKTTSKEPGATCKSTNIPTFTNTANTTSKEPGATCKSTNIPTPSTNTDNTTPKEPGTTCKPTKLSTPFTNKSMFNSQASNPTPSTPVIVNKSKIALSSTITRVEFAAIKIPPVSATSSSQANNIRPILDDFQPTDPFTLLKRPPETAVDCAERAFQQKSKGKTVKGVEIELHGLFSREGLAILRKFCEIAQVKRKIAEEEDWLQIQGDGVNLAEVNEIKDMLWNNKLTATVLKAGLKSIDVSSFSTLVKERYLDNFVIDTVITKYAMECGSGGILYLPSEVHAWLRSDDKQFVLDKLALVLRTLDIDSNKLNTIMMPVHMNGCHWGLVAIDLTSKIIYFDDGYKLNPEPALVTKVKNLLTLVKCLIPNIDNLKDVIKYERFGMPYQGDLDLMGQGAGSCGMGVIMSARDFIMFGIPTALNQFDWDFKRMRTYRKQLMAQIVSWAKKK